MVLTLRNEAYGLSLNESSFLNVEMFFLATDAQI